MKFIELTDYRSGKKTLINLEYILYIDERDGYTNITLKDSYESDVKEDFFKIKEAIKLASYQ